MNSIFGKKAEQNISIYLSIYQFLSISFSLHTCVDMRKILPSELLYIYIYIYIYIYMCVCVCVCVCVCECVCVCVRILYHHVFS